VGDWLDSEPDQRTAALNAQRRREWPGPELERRVLLEVASRPGGLRTLGFLASKLCRGNVRSAYKAVRSLYQAGYFRHPPVEARPNTVHIWFSPQANSWGWHHADWLGNYPEAHMTRQQQVQERSRQLARLVSEDPGHPGAHYARLVEMPMHLLTTACARAVKDGLVRKEGRGRGTRLFPVAEAARPTPREDSNDPLLKAGLRLLQARNGLSEAEAEHEQAWRSWEEALHARVGQ